MRNRRGFTVMEIMISLALLAGAGVIAAQVITATLQKQAALDHHDRALIVAQNLMEDARQRPFDQITPAWAGQLKAEETDALVKADLTSDGPLKKLTLTVTWRSSLPVTLTTWFAP